MKLLFVLLLCAASVALLRAEDPEPEVDYSDDTSLEFLHDGSIEDEVLGHDEDRHKKFKLALRKRLGIRVFCAVRVFKPCMQKAHKLPCKIRYKVCKAAFFTCHCIARGVGKCVKFLRFVRRLRQRLMCMKHLNKHDEAKKDEDEDEDEEEDEDHRRKKHKKFIGFIRCIKHAKKHCKPGLFKFCVKKFFKSHFGHRKGDEDEATTQLAESKDEEDEEDQQEDEDPRKMMFKKKHLPKVCAILHVRCVNRARFNCRRHIRCFRRLKRCLRIIKLIRKIKQHKGKQDE